MEKQNDLGWGKEKRLYLEQRHLWNMMSCIPHEVVYKGTDVAGHPVIGQLHNSTRVAFIDSIEAFLISSSSLQVHFVFVCFG